MLQLHKAIAALFAGCFCTMTMHQLPILGSAFEERARPVLDAIRITHVGDTDTWTEPEPESLPEQQLTCTLPPEPEQPEEPIQTTAPPVATPVTTTTVTSVLTEPTVPAETTTTVVTTADLPEETTACQQTDDTASAVEPDAETETIPIDDQSLFDIQETWFKAYMDYRTITDISSAQYELQQSAWTDEHGLRRIGDDYLVAMGTGWLEEGCGERFLVTLEGGETFTVVVGDIKADCDTDPTRRYRNCGGGANVLEFIVDTWCMTSEAKNAGTVSVYAELEGNIAEIARIE
ncbi:hypothetical protein [Ruminococcus sp.]|uniref:hypothetical protein n=1 Tax=Ruminococcus sp. TaxID=41978 RepID=UPI0026013D5E|nr:hypothetical protein [Ruminococcus sp.]